MRHITFLGAATAALVATMPAQAQDGAIDKRVERLRRKLEKHGLDIVLIETVRSDGYIYKGPVTRS